MIGHRFADGPRLPALLVFPTQKLAGSMSTDRVGRLLREVPALSRIHSKGKADSKFEKWLAGTPLRFGWAGSATELAAHPCGLVLVDELDRMIRDVAGEGDPVTLARARTKNYPGSLVVVTSSPTVEDASPVQALFDGGSMEIWQWRCPECGEYHRPLSMYLRWPEGSSADQAEAEGAYHCPECGAAVDERHKPAMVASGRFWPHQRDADGNYRPREIDQIRDFRHRSFWVSGFASPWVRFSDLARELCGAYRSREPETIQATINTYFGELWRMRGDAPEWQEVARHRLNYKQGEHPYGVQAVTVGADVQMDRIYYVVRGWGAENGPNESWLLEHGELLGNTEVDDVWIAFARVLRRHDLKVRRAFVDSGYKPQSDFYVRPAHKVYTVCRSLQPLAFPSKGYAQQNKPVSMAPKDINAGGVTIKNGVTLATVDTSYFKQWVYSRIRIGEEQDDLWHLPADASEDYMRQVVAEELIIKASGQMEWQARRSKPNHYLDCEVLAAAAAYSLNLYTLNPLPKERPGGAKPAPGRQAPRGNFQRGGL